MCVDGSGGMSCVRLADADETDADAGCDGEEIVAGTDSQARHGEPVNELAGRRSRHGKQEERRCPAHGRPVARSVHRTEFAGEGLRGRSRGTDGVVDEQLEGSVFQ